MEMESSESMAQELKEIKTGESINHCSIDTADNGYIVEWSEKEEKPEGSMEHCNYTNHKKIFTSKQEDEAWELYKKLKMSNMKYRKKSMY